MSADRESVRRGVEAAFEAMVAGRLTALESQVADPDTGGVAGEVMRSAGYPTALWQRVRALERRLKAYEDRLQAVEAGLLNQATPRSRLPAWLERLRTAWLSRQAGVFRARGAQGKAE